MPRYASLWGTVMENKSFEEMLSELEELATRLESGDITLEEALETYKKGTLLASECAKLLDNAEKQIKILVKDGDKLTETDFSEN